MQLNETPQITNAPPQVIEEEEENLPPKFASQI
jgi:hypothetical protein